MIKRTISDAVGILDYLRRVIPSSGLDVIFNVVRKRSEFFTSEIKKTDVMAKQKKKDILYDARRGGSR
jgi:hypothetical protein